MSSILDIPQIAVTPMESLQNDMHIRQGADISRRLQNARWTDSTHATKVFPDNVDALMADFIAAQAAEDEVYVLSQASEFTKQRLEKDAQRDTLYKEIKRTVDTFATLSIFPDKQAAALVMQPLMQKYNIQPDGGIEAQTVATDQWLQEQDMSAQADAASMTLGIRESLRQLKTLTAEIQQLMQQRQTEGASYVVGEMKAARAESENLLAQVIQYLNALLVVSPSEALEQTAQYIQQDMNKTEQQYQQGRKHGKKDDEGDVTPVEPEVNE